MLNSAMKTTNRQDIVFAWSEEDCRALGIERRDAMLAWRVLNDGATAAIDEKTLLLFGYEERSSYMNIIIHPNYLRAMRVMLAQYTNAVCLPEAIRTNLSIATNTSAPEAARVRAAGKLIDYAEQSLDRFRKDYGKPIDDLDPEALQRVIKYLEGLKGVSASIDERPSIDGQIAVLSPTSNDYLSDLL